MNVHPAAEVFPMMSGAGFDDLVADIAKNGQLEPIALLADGTLLDGRNRLRACEQLGIEPVTRVVKTDSPTQFVVSANLMRRNLTNGQRTAIGVELEAMLAEDAKERKRQGGRDAGRGRPQKVPVETSEPIGESRTHAAKAVGVAPTQISLGKRLRVEAPKLYERVRAGELSIGTAMREHKGEVRPKPTTDERIARTRPGKHRDMLEKSAFQKASDYVGKVAAVSGYCQAISVDAVRSDERLRRLWVEAAEDAIKALRHLKGQLKGS